MAKPHACQLPTLTDQCSPLLMNLHMSGRLLCALLCGCTCEHYLTLQVSALLAASYKVLPCTQADVRKELASAGYVPSRDQQIPKDLDYSGSGCLC